MWKRILIILTVIVVIAGASFATAKLLINRDAATSDAGNENLDYDPSDYEDVIVEEDESTDEDYNGISYKEEGDNYTVKKVKASPEMFIGTWRSTSDRAIYYYGDVELTIKDNGTWKGIITEEDVKGTWTFSGNTMHMNDVVVDFDFDLAFNNTGKLLMIERLEDGELHTVLTRK